MFFYYLKVALRNLKRNKIYSSICVIGLGIGFCAAILIGLYINDELSFEHWLPDYEKIHRLQVSFNSTRYPTVPSDTGLWLRQDYPQVEEVTRTIVSTEIVSKGNLEFSETVTWADANVFDVFKFPIVAGNLTEALSQPDGLVIDRDTAEKYFPSHNPIGELLLIDGKHNMRINAIIENLPSNTHLTASIFASGHAIHSELAEQDRNPVTVSFGRKAWATNTYVLLGDGIPPASIETNLPDMMDRHLPPNAGRNNSDTYHLELMPISDIHLSSPNSSESAVDLNNIYTVTAIAILIVLVASINFINIMTARSIKRRPEIILRKRLGAERSGLYALLMTESFLYIFLGTIIALFLSLILLPAFNGYLLRTIEFSVFNNVELFLGIIITIFLTWLISGIYPVIVLIGQFNGKATTGILSSKTGYTSLGLIFLQFAILSSLVIGGISIYQQVQFGIREALRKTVNPIVLITAPCSTPLLQELNALPSVLNVACSNEIPQISLGSKAGMGRTVESAISVSYTSLNPDYLNLYQIELLAGRNFEETRIRDISPTDNNWVTPEAIVVNKSTAFELGFADPEEAIGQIVGWRHLFRLPNVFTPTHAAEIIGVTEDFQIGSIRNEIPSAAFFYDPQQLSEIHVLIDAAFLSGTLNDIDAIWERLGDSEPINRRLFDKTVESIYQDIMRQSQLLTIYAAVAIFIASLGLIGLAAHIIEKRTKEIGIRKVVGASRFEILSMMLWQFSKPVLASNLLAWPITYYLLSQWLSGFQRHVDLQWWTFLGASTATLIVAVLTVFTHAYVSAGRNPITALRYE